MSNEAVLPSEAGFEYGGRFYRWHVSDMGKDLMLIDRFSGLPILDFFDVVDDEHERMRGPMLLTLIACSMRHGNPEWSVERVVRTVMGLNLSDVQFVGGDDEEEDSAQPVPPPTSELRAVRSSSTSTDSSSLPTPEADEDSPTSYATPA